LPAPGDRDAWLAEGTEAYRIFIRSLLSVTDNIVEGKVVHPGKLVIRDGEDPYFVVAADKGTATFSDIANGIALERKFWLGDAFASGGSQGYDHKAMGITARGAWVSVTRHFAEMGVDVQKDPVTVVGCGDMSGDVFGNGMLLSKALKLVAAFDHRHIFLDPNPDPVKSWKERERMFNLPRSSWADYDAKLISKGGGVFPRSQKQIPLSPEVKAVLGIADDQVDPSTLISAILRAPADLLWFGGIGTYVKASHESNSEVGDVTNDANRVNGEDVRAKVIGEGANLGVTQEGRIAFAAKGGRINTDFIDNSAGVDCSDNEVNIKIPLNREMMEGRLGFEDRNAFLKEMTDEVAEIVLEDNRLQTLALSLAEKSGADALPSQVRVLEMLEASGRINRTVDNFESNQDLLRRAQEHRGLTRPELAVLMSHSKLALQAAIERSDLAADPLLVSTLHGSFPATMQKRFARAIDQHRLRGEIIATELANRIVNRLGFVIPFELAEEEGVSLAQIGTAYVAADALLGLADLWTGIENAALPEQARLALFDAAAGSVRFHVADILRAMPAGAQPHEITGRLAKPIERLNRSLPDLLREVAVRQADAMRDRLAIAQDDPALVERIVRLYELDGVFGIAALSEGHGLDAIQATKAYALLGERLGLDWAKATASRYVPLDPWERLLAAGLARDFESLRLDFLGRADGKDPVASVETWLRDHDARIAQFRTLVDRARAAAIVTVSMLAQIASQARLLLAR
jgi:glutamate dehydrogenase